VLVFIKSSFAGQNSSMPISLSDIKSLSSCCSSPSSKTNGKHICGIFRPSRSYPCYPFHQTRCNTASPPNRPHTRPIPISTRATLLRVPDMDLFSRRVKSPIPPSEQMPQPKTKGDQHQSRRNPSKHNISHPHLGTQANIRPLFIGLVSCRVGSNRPKQAAQNQKPQS